MLKILEYQIIRVLEFILPTLARNVKYCSEWKQVWLKGDFSAEHKFSLDLETGTSLMENIQRESSRIGEGNTFPAELVQSWIEWEATFILILYYKLGGTILLQNVCVNKL